MHSVHFIDVRFCIERFSNARGFRKVLGVARRATSQNPDRGNSVLEQVQGRLQVAQGQSFYSAGVAPFSAGATVVGHQISLVDGWLMGWDSELRLESGRPPYGQTPQDPASCFTGQKRRRAYPARKSPVVATRLRLDNRHSPCRHRQIFGESRGFYTRICHHPDDRPAQFWAEHCQ